MQMLSLDRAPPFAAPLRFFLGAPLFVALAGLLVAFDGGMVFASRWTPAALAATHLITVGGLLQVMLGALIQVLPVVAGASLARPLGLARVVHGGLVLGTLGLAGGFYFARPAALIGGALLLAGAVAAFLVAAAQALAGVPSTSPTIRGVKLALAGLAGTVGLGGLLALGLGNALPLPYGDLADLHAAWGFAAWAGILLAAMAYVVVPMFQLTPGYPARPSWLFPRLIALAVLGWSLALAVGRPELARLAQLLLAGLGLVFCGLTWRLQKQRRRARVDATTRYWQGGLLASSAALGMLAAAALLPPLAALSAWPALFAILLGLGGFFSFIAGMLYKILPFLAWLHLQNAGVAAPPMNRLLDDAQGLRQARAWFAALGLLLAAALAPRWLALPAGLALAGAALWLERQLFGAWRNYRRLGAGGQPQAVAA